MGEASTELTDEVEGSEKTSMCKYAVVSTGRLSGRGQGGGSGLQISAASCGAKRSSEISGGRMLSIFSAIVSRVVRWSSAAGFGGAGVLEAEIDIGLLKKSMGG